MHDAMRTVKMNQNSKIAIWKIHQKYIFPFTCVAITPSRLVDVSSGDIRLRETAFSRSHVGTTFFIYHYAEGRLHLELAN